ncbi:MAG: AgmX/PglI C-terminal domain-containing protein [Kofleriaceae bacterium]
MSWRRGELNIGGWVTSQPLVGIRSTRYSNALLFVVCVAVGGCGTRNTAGGASEESATHPLQPGTAPDPVRLASVLPVVTATEAVAAFEGAPPLAIVGVRGDGSLVLADAPRTWSELPAFDLSQALPLDKAALADATRVGSEFQVAPNHPMVAHEIYEQRSRDAGVVAMPIDAGQAVDSEAGRVIADGRVEGQYQMKKERMDPSIERAGEIGIEHKPLDGPVRQSAVAGSWDLNTFNIARYTVIAASASAPASSLIAAITASRGAIAVRVDNEVRLLRLRFAVPADYKVPWSWVEARVSASGIDFEAVPALAVTMPWSSGPIDHEQFAKAYNQALRAGTTPGQITRRNQPVDVLVSPDVDVQRLIDTLVALHRAGVRITGLGLAPEGEEANKRNRPAPPPLNNALVAISPDALIDHVLPVARELQSCVGLAWRANPVLAGTIRVQWDIASDGTVTRLRSSGTEPEIAQCVADKIKPLKFPRKTKGIHGTVSIDFRP